MQSGRSVTHRCKSPLFGLLAGVVIASLVGSWILAQPDGQPAARSRVFRLKHLNSQAAEKLVAELDLRGELSVVGTDAVIFTSTDSGELRVASAVFKVVDSPKTYTLTPLDAPASFLEACRKNPLVFNIEGFAVGTFDDPPAASSAHSALVDVRSGRLLVIAPKDNDQRLIEAVRQRIAAASPKPAAVSQPAPKDERTDSPSLPPATGARTTTTAEEPFVGPPAPPTEELARRSTEPTSPEPTSPGASEPADPTASVSPSEATGTEKPKTTGEEMLTAIKPAAQTEPNATPAAPVQEEDKIDQAIERAVEAEKEAVLAELEAAEAERKAKETDEALAKLMALVEQTDQPAAADAEKPTDQVKPEAEGEQTPTPPAATESEPTEAAQPKPAPTGSGSTRPTAKPAATGPSESQKAAEEPAQAAPAQKPVGEATEPDAKALTPEQMKQIEAEGQAGLMKLLELVQSEAAKSQPEPSVPPRPTPSADTTTPAPSEPKAAPKIQVQPGTQAPDQTPDQTPAPTPEPTPSETQTAPSATDDYIDHLNIPNAEKELDTIVTVPEQIEIMALIELVGKELGLNYVYDPTQVKGTVMLKVHDGKIKVKDTYALLESVLKFKGLVMTRRGNLVTIIREAEALKYDPAIITPDRPIQPGDIIVTGVMQLENITTQTAENMLKSMQLGLGFNSIPETQTLIVTDYAYRMRRIQEIIDLVDVSGQQRRITSRTLKYTVASKLAPKVQTLAGFLDTVQVTVSEAPAAPTPPTPAQARTTAARPATPARPTPAAAAQAQAADTVHLDTDDRTNRIFMIGLEDKVKVVEGLIDQLDVPGQSLRTIREYEIQYIDTSEVVNALYELGVISTRPETTAPVGTLRSTPSRTPTPSRPRPSAAEETASPDDPLISVRQATNSLLINATEEQHAEIAMVIAHVDTEQTDSRTIKEYEIQHVDAAEIINTLSELGFLQPATRGMTGTSGTTRTTPARTTTPPRPTQPGANPQAPAQAAPAPPPATGGGEPATAQDIVADYPQIAVLEATNSLLVSATPRQHAAIALIISHVDRELDQVSTPFVVYALENQDPEELAGTLGELVNAQIRAQAAQAGGAAAGGAAAARDPRIQTRTTPGAGRRSDDFDITIVPDKATYSLVVYANKKNQQWISELIKQLDNYRPQVLLDVTLVEITRQDDFSYDLNLISSIPDLAYTSGLTGSISGGTRVGDILDLLSAAPDRNEFIDLQSNSGNFTGFYGDNKIQALFTAIQTKKYGRILAKPKLLVDDNQEGTIETKTTTYITRTRSSTQVPDTGAPFTTTDTTFEPYDASISLAIEPHISQGDNLRLRITLSRSDFLNLDPSSEKPPNQAISDVQTVVTVPNNSTIILGGMDKVNQSRGGDKVPILGDIPLLGGLFRSASNTSDQSKLYIFIKAHILRPGNRAEGRDDLVRISERNRAEFEKAEDQMQKYEDWPGIKPKPMDPLRVLEEDIERVGETVVPGQDNGQ